MLEASITMKLNETGMDLWFNFLEVTTENKYEEPYRRQMLRVVKKEKAKFLIWTKALGVKILK